MWDNTVNKAYRVKGEIQPLQNAAADGVRTDIAAFGDEVRGWLYKQPRTGVLIVLRHPCVGSAALRILRCVQNQLMSEETASFRGLCLA